MKTLINRDGNGVQKNVPDVEFFGDPDGFQLICKAASQEEGWMKSTKAMEIPGVGCLVQVTTRQQSGINDSYVIAEALTFVPGVQIDCIHELGNEDKLIGRRLISISEVARKGPRGPRGDTPINTDVEGQPDLPGIDVPVEGGFDSKAGDEGIVTEPDFPGIEEPATSPEVEELD